MSERVVRPAESEDASTIEGVARESWHAAYDEFLGAGTVNEVLDEWYDLDGLREAAREDDHLLLVATETSEIRGFAHVHAGPTRERGVWNLFRIYVASGYWGEGFGTVLLEAIESELRAREVPAYELAVLAENDRGVSFYDSRGFERFETETVELAGVETTQHWYRKEL